MEEGEIAKEAPAAAAPLPPPLPPPPPPPAPAAALPKPLPPRQLLKRPLAAAFDGDEEEDDATEKKSRKLIPIHYSAEELRSMQEGGAAAPAPAAPAADPADERKKRVMASVPKDKDALFAYEVKWEVLDRAPLEVKSKLAGESDRAPSQPSFHTKMFPCWILCLCRMDQQEDQ